MIAIIMLLAALLLPSLRHARERAGTAICASNERQFTIALIVSVDDDFWSGFQYWGASGGGCPDPPYPRPGSLPAHSAGASTGDRMAGLPLLKKQYLPTLYDQLVCPTSPRNIFISCNGSSSSKINVNPFTLLGQFTPNPNGYGPNGIYSGYSYYRAGFDGTNTLSTVGPRIPNGTYHYFGGAAIKNCGPGNPIDTRYLAEPFGPVQSVTANMIVDAAKYLVLFDFAPTRSLGDPELAGLSVDQRYAMSPHPLGRGRNYAFWDGHVSYIKDGALGPCSSAAGFAQYIEDVGPVFDYDVFGGHYWLPGRTHGDMYYSQCYPGCMSSLPPAQAFGDVLRLP